MMDNRQTIVAVATGVGGALAVVRVSGTDAIEICDRAFRSHSTRPLSECKGYTLHYGEIMGGDGVIDDVVLSLFRTPRSYTGEDMVEISCHGSTYIQHEIIKQLISLGARTAEPGEFTIRAFLAGKIDLAQAEAVADMIASTDRATHALATNQMRGGYSTEFSTLRDRLIELVSLLELELDFGEEDVEFADRSELLRILEQVTQRVETLLGSFSLGNAVKEGVAVAIVGSPNVGKSTLLNALLKEERAMVSEIAGTTRDVIEESLNIDGIRFRFIDTAGIRTTTDRLEQMGIERTFSSIERAHIVLLMVDATELMSLSADCSNPPDSIGSVIPCSAIEHYITQSLSGIRLRNEQKLCVVLNKCDKLPQSVIDHIVQMVRKVELTATNSSDSVQVINLAASMNDNTLHTATNVKQNTEAAHKMSGTSTKDNSGKIDIMCDSDKEFDADSMDSNSGSKKQYADSGKIDIMCDSDKEFDADSMDSNSGSKKQYAAYVGKIDVISISAKNSQNISSLTSFLSANINSTPLYNGSTIVSNTRHFEALHNSKISLQHANFALQSGIAPDLLSQDLREVLHHLGTITGEITTTDILTSIFSKFCIGK